MYLCQSRDYNEEYQDLRLAKAVAFRECYFDKKNKPMTILLTRLAGWINRQQTGIKSVKISLKSPNMTPYAEQFIRTIKTEYLAKSSIFAIGYWIYSKKNPVIILTVQLYSHVLCSYKE